MPQKNKEYSAGNPYAADLYSPDNPYANLVEEDEGAAPTGGATTAFTDFTGRGIIDSVLAIPAAAGQVLAQGVAGTEAALEGGASVLTGGDFDFNRRANRNLNDDILGPLNSIPSMDTNQLGAIARSIPGLFGSQLIGERFDEELATLQGDEAAQREAHPTASGLGDVGGDVASLFLGRDATGASAKMKKFEDFIMNAGKKVKPEIAFGAISQLDNVSPNAMGFINEKVLNSSGWRTLLKGAGRAGEAGFEAVVLDILNGDDPNETAAYVVGGQLVGGMSLEAMKALTSGGKGPASAKIAAAGLVAAGLWQMVKQTTPGGENSPIQSIKTGYEKVILALAAGGLSGLAGAGRFRGPGSEGFQASMPRLADALTAVPRAAVISLVEEMKNADRIQQQQAEAALQLMSTNPESLSDKVMNTLNDGFESGHFIESVDGLMQDADFSRMIFSSSPPELQGGN